MRTKTLLAIIAIIHAGMIIALICAAILMQRFDLIFEAGIIGGLWWIATTCIKDNQK